jgi:RNA polymerase sigma-70 factor (ECF subfamily)
MDTQEYLSTQQFIRLKSGDKTAFKMVYDQYFGLIHYMVKRCGLSDDESLDIVQESFFKLYQNVAILQSSQGIKSWLITTARNMAVDYIRKRKTENSYIATAECTPGVPQEQDVLSHSMLRALEVELLDELLSEFEQQTKDDTLSLFYKQGLSAKTIAEAKGEAISTVTSRISRARQKFRKTVETHIKNLHDNVY